MKAHNQQNLPTYRINYRIFHHLKKVSKKRKKTRAIRNTHTQSYWMVYVHIILTGNTRIWMTSSEYSDEGDQWKLPMVQWCALLLVPSTNNRVRFLFGVTRQEKVNQTRQRWLYWKQKCNDSKTVVAHMRKGRFI